MITVVFKGEIFPDGNRFIGLCRELDVSSFGDTSEDARASLQEAVAAFLEGCDLLGTLGDVLEEAGFEMVNGVWRLRKRITVSEIATVP